MTNQLFERFVGYLVYVALKMNSLPDSVFVFFVVKCSIHCTVRNILHIYNSGIKRSHKELKLHHLLR